MRCVYGPDTGVNHYVRRIILCVSKPALTSFYASAIVLLVQSQQGRTRLAPLASVGRTALSNYLLQSMICTTIFYGYGLGLYKRVGPAFGMWLGILIYLPEVVLSVWWLSRFQFGPAEWLWRSLTYGKLQPMRIRSAAFSASY